MGAAMFGFVKIPFIKQGKRKVAVKIPKDDPYGGPLAPYLSLANDAARLASVEPKKSTPPAPKMDTGPGEAKLAALWAELPADRLATVVVRWPQAQLGRILSLMDEDAVTALLTALPPARAASLSQIVARATDETAAKVHTKDEK